MRALRPANLLLVHVRGTSARDGFLAYYTRHSIEPGADRLFFFNVDGAGADLGDPRPYTAHVETQLGPARFLSGGKLDLSEWPLGLPIGFVFDEDEQRASATFVGGGGAATEVLPSPSDVDHLLEDPGAFLVSYRPGG